jgi:iron complex transport system permease protein
MQQPWIILRSRNFSARLDKRVPIILTIALLATISAMVINIGVGEYPIPAIDVLKTVFHLPTGEEDYNFVVNTLRLPRMLVAALIGLSLGISGTIMQGLTRNPLADPEILGISAGAGLVVVSMIVIFRTLPSSLIPFGALLGASLNALLIYTLSWRNGDSPMRMILIGIGLAAISSAALNMMITFGDIDDVQSAMLWLAGSVYGKSWKDFWTLLPWVLVLVPLALFMARDLNLLNLGEDISRSLGINVPARRGFLLLIAVALAAATVSVAGSIGFVGLMAPHIARRLVGPDHVGVIPTAAAIGTLLVVVADLIGRTIVAPIEIPCGLVTAAIGAPFFVYLMLKQARG